MTKDPFADAFANLIGLTSQATYRLGALTPDPLRWDEESLTALLAAQLTHVRPFRIEADCPHDSHRSGADASACQLWSGKAPTSISGGLRGVTRRAEGGGDLPLGADLLLRFVGANGAEVRMMLQAKRLVTKGARLESVSYDKLTARSKGSQFDQLMQAASFFGAHPFYLFNLAVGDAHRQYVDCGCPYHQGPQPHSSVLVHARNVGAFYGRGKRKARGGKPEMRELLELGRPLECLGSQRCNDGIDVLHRISQTLNELGGANDDTGGRPFMPEFGSQLTIQTAQISATYPRAEPETTRGNSTGNIVAVALGERRDAPKGDSRQVIGWSPDSPSNPLELRDSARMWWVMNAKRASNMHFLAAWSRRTRRVVGAWLVTGMFHDSYDESGRRRTRCGFQLADDEPPATREVRRMVQQRIDAGALDSRNPVSYL